MGKLLLPGITTVDRAGLTPDQKEIIFDTDENAIYLGDGSTAGGVPIGGSSGGTDVFGEEFTGATTSTLTLAHSALAGKTRVYKNGIRLPASEFSVSGTTVTLTSARDASDIFIVDYKY